MPKKKNTSNNKVSTPKSNKNDINKLKILFPDWTEEDLDGVLREYGDFDTACDKISSGNVEQWSSVSKKPKPKPQPVPTQQTSHAPKTNTQNNTTPRTQTRGPNPNQPRFQGQGQGQTQNQNQNRDQNRDQKKEIRAPQPTVPIKRDLSAVSQLKNNRPGTPILPATFSRPIGNSWAKPLPASNFSVDNALQANLNESTSSPLPNTYQNEALELEKEETTQELKEILQQESVQENKQEAFQKPQHIDFQHQGIQVLPTQRAAKIEEVEQSLHEMLISKSPNQNHSPTQTSSQNQTQLHPQNFENQKEFSPVVLPNFGYQGLNLQFGSIELGIEEQKKSGEAFENKSFEPQKQQQQPAPPKDNNNAGVPFDGSYPYMGMGMPGYGYGLPMHPMGMGFYDRVDPNVQQRMMYYEPSYQQHQPQAYYRNNVDKSANQKDVHNPQPYVQMPYFPVFHFQQNYHPMQGQFPPGSYQPNMYSPTAMKNHIQHNSQEDEQRFYPKNQPNPSGSGSPPIQQNVSNESFKRYNSPQGYQNANSNPSQNPNPNQNQNWRT